MVEMASKKFVCIVDDTKMVDGLGGSKCTPLCSLHAQLQPCSRMPVMGLTGSW